MTSRRTLSDLPDEVIHAILLYVPPDDLPATQRVSKHFDSLCNEPLLWRFHCKTQFKYWNPSHDIRRKFKLPVASVDWKKVYIARRVIDHQTTQLLDGIIESQTGRIEKTQQIVALGYDAKDTLLRHSRAGDEVEDVLARRYHSDAVLGCLHRTRAVEQWVRLKSREDVPLEKALGAYDMFILHEREGDLDEVSSILDNLASTLRRRLPNIHELTTRETALAVATFLRERNLTGLTSERAYRNLYNNFIGIALQDEDHPSLPLISVVIYCCVATRLGLAARPCGFPFHVHAMVYAPAGQTLDDIPEPGSAASPASDLGLFNEGIPEVMYLDPFRSDQEIPVADLIAQLYHMEVPAEQHSSHLSELPTSQIVLRAARNIIYSVQESQRTPITAVHSIRMHTDMEDAFYAALWASIILSTPIPAGRVHRGLVQIPGRQYLPHIVKNFELQNPMDVTLVERFILPLFYDERHDSLLETTRVVRAGDKIPKKVVRRNSDAARQGVIYRVGQVFRHKRYGYRGVITGWDLECGMDQGWILQNRVDGLDRGRHQSFYHVLVDDKSVRYVAEENIEIEQPEEVGELMELAGKHFKRWDKETKTFVSNIRDEYPDD